MFGEQISSCNSIIAIPALIPEHAISSIEKTYKKNLSASFSYVRDCIMGYVPEASEYCDDIISMLDRHYPEPLQAGELTETVIAATLAYAIGMQVSYDYSSPQVRSRYENDDYCIERLGSPDLPDIMFYDSQGEINIEVKMQFARTGELDLFYDEDGALFFKQTRKKTSDILQDVFYPVINIFNQNNSIFDHIGHNIQFSDFCDDWVIRDAAYAYFSAKSAQYIATISGEHVILCPTNMIDEIALFDEAEIRPLGKNRKVPFTVNYMRDEIEKAGGIYQGEENLYYMPWDALTPVKKRGGEEIGRYKFGAFLIHVNDIVKIEENQYVCGYVKQLSPLITAKIKFLPEDMILAKSTFFPLP